MSSLPLALPASDDAAPPRRNGELVFDAPWQGRAFGLCIALLEREGLGWDDFRPYLVARIAEDEGRGYYESLVLALEDFVDKRAIHDLTPSQAAP